MEIVVQHIADCPNWRTTADRLATLAAEIEDITVREQLIDGTGTAAERGFRGSPTVLIDGVDPFADGDAGAIGLACRIYPSERGATGSPTLEQLRAAIAAARCRS